MWHLPQVHIMRIKSDDVGALGMVKPSKVMLPLWGLPTLKIQLDQEPVAFSFGFSARVKQRTGTVADRTCQISVLKWAIRKIHLS